MATERITAPLVKKALDEHLQRHELKLDPKLHNVHEAVFGPGNQGGICDQVEKLRGNISMIDKRLTNIENGINKVLWVVVLAVLGAVLKLVFIP